METLRYLWVVAALTGCLAVRQKAGPARLPSPSPRASTAPSTASREHRGWRGDPPLMLVAPTDPEVFELEPYRKNYATVSHDRLLRELPSSAADGRNKSNEIKFQISLRYPFARSDDHRGRFVLAYTATSRWQLFDWQGSAPFRTTDQEPEAFYEYDQVECSRQWRLGLDHNSNGESGPASRSWNRVFVEAIFYDPDGFRWDAERSFVHRTHDSGLPQKAVTWKASLRVWEKFAVDNDNNGDISAFFGYFEARGEWFWDTTRAPHLSLLLRNNGRLGGDNRGALGLDYSWELYEGVRLLLNSFHGYGESLLDYNRRANRIGFGIELSP